MFTSAYKLIATVATLAALLFASAAMAGAPSGRPGSSNNNGKGSAANALHQQNLNRDLKKEQYLKNKNSGGVTITQGGGNLPKEPGNNPNGGFTITQGGGNLPKEPGNNPDKSGNYDCDHGHDHDCYKYRYYNRSGNYGCYATSVEPVNSYVVVPGDTFETISMKVFGDSGASMTIATFNRLPVNAVLVPGQVLMLPAVSPAL